MLCEKYKCIFIHVPKVAGQSIERVFLRLHGLNWDQRGALLLRPNEYPELGPPRLAHLKASEYISCGYVSQEKFQTYFKFSFVRNPWDRIVSEYKFRKYPFRMDFKTFLFSHLPEPGWTDSYRHIIPQYEFLYEDGVCLVDFIGRFENLSRDFGCVCKKLQIELGPLPHANSTSNHKKKNKGLIKYLSGLSSDKRWRKNTFDHYSEYYDNESKEYVGNMYKQDIMAFNYNFENQYGRDKAR